MIKEVVNIYGEKVMIDTDGQKVYSYNNAKKVIRYVAKRVDSDCDFDSYTDYREEGVVTDLETRIRIFGSRLIETYARSVGYNASDNDPDRKIWKSFVKFVEKNESKFFDENGDYRDKFLISEDDIREMVHEVERR